MRLFVLDYNLLMAFMMTVLIGIVLYYWVVYTLSRKKRFVALKDEDLKQCPFCLFLFCDVRQGHLVRCPCCNSYLEQGKV